MRQCTGNGEFGWTRVRAGEGGGGFENKGKGDGGMGVICYLYTRYRPHIFILGYVSYIGYIYWGTEAVIYIPGGLLPCSSVALKQKFEICKCQTKAKPRPTYFRPSPHKRVTNRETRAHLLEHAPDDLEHRWARLCSRHARRTSLIHQPRRCGKGT